MTTNKYSGTKTNTNLVFHPRARSTTNDASDVPNVHAARSQHPVRAKSAHVETQIVSVLKRTGDELLQRRIQQRRLLPPSIKARNRRIWKMAARNETT